MAIPSGMTEKKQEIRIMSEHQPRISKELSRCVAADAEWLHEVACDACQSCPVDCKIMKRDLEEFTARVLGEYGASPAEAEITARVLVSSDLRGIPSHGVARLGRYVSGMRDGYIKPGVEFSVEEPAPAIGVIDAHDGIGQVVSEMAMDMAIDKAKANGIGMVTVRNSNHYGIAGYYVLKALEHRMIGMSMTNTAPLVVPTGGAAPVLGTNPIAFGAPASSRCPMLLDTATSVVPRGKLEVYDRNAEQMPDGWAVDEKGFDCPNPGHVLANLLGRRGGGILPLGGRGETFGGHKGYGLALMVDVLSGVLSGSAFGPDVHNLGREVANGERATPRVGHFFMALDVGRFMPIARFEERMDELMTIITQSPKALDAERIFIHGEKEFIRAELHEKSGIPLRQNVLSSLRSIAREAGIEPPRTLADRLGQGQDS
jgi:LDH2 family malate/lactate/ureidoglycolate dehydrogenase